jgi:O-antigen ligase
MNAVRPVPGATVADLCFVPATLLALPSLLLERPPYFRVPVWFMVAAAGIVLAVLVSTLGNAGLHSNLGTGLRFAISVVVTPLLLGYVSATEERVAVLADLWVLGAVVNSVVATTDFVKLTDIGYRVSGVDFRTWTHRTQGLTSHPNHLGLVAAMALPIALSRTMTTSGRRRALYLAAAVLLCFGVLASGSRADLVAALVGVVVLPLLHPIARRPLLAAVAVCVVGVAIVATVVSTARTDVLVAVHRLDGSDSVSQSDAERSALLHHAFSQFRAHPLTGAGFAVVRNAHDIYLQLLAAGGVLALISFLLFAGGILSLGVRLRRAKALPPATQHLAAACTASMTVWLVCGILANQIFDRYLYLPAGLLLGLWFVERRKELAGGAPQAVPVNP